jgi:hypothetical protein
MSLTPVRSDRKKTPAEIRKGLVVRFVILILVLVAYFAGLFDWISSILSG